MKVQWFKVHSKAKSWLSLTHFTRGHFWSRDKQRWRSHHSICHNRKPPATGKPRSSMFHRTRDIAERSLALWEQRFSTSFCSCDLDLDAQHSSVIELLQTSLVQSTVRSVVSREIVLRVIWYSLRNYWIVFLSAVTTPAPEPTTTTTTTTTTTPSTTTRELVLHRLRIYQWW